MKNNEKRPKEKSLATSTFFAGSLGIFCTGMMLGIYHQLKKEKFVLNSESNRGPFMIACKAFLYGSVLCFAGFGGGVAAIAATTGTSSLQEFTDLSRRVMSSKQSLASYQQAIEREKALMKSLNFSEESSYWTNYFSSESDQRVFDILKDKQGSNK